MRFFLAMLALALLFIGALETSYRMGVVMAQVERPNRQMWMFGEQRNTNDWSEYRVYVIDTPGACIYVIMTGNITTEKVYKDRLPPGKGCQ